MTVYKMIDVVGTSQTSISDAVRGAVERAGSTLDDLQWFEVKDIRGRIGEGNVAEFQVQVQIGFKVHAAKETDGHAERVVAKRKTPTSTEARTASPQARSVAAQAAAKRGERGRTDIVRGEAAAGRGAKRGRA